MSACTQVVEWLLIIRQLRDQNSELGSHQIKICLCWEPSRLRWARLSFSLSFKLSGSGQYELRASLPRFQSRPCPSVGFPHSGQPGWSCCRHGRHSGLHYTDRCFYWLPDGILATEKACFLPALRTQHNGHCQPSCNLTQMANVIPVTFPFSTSAGEGALLGEGSVG